MNKLRKFNHHQEGMIESRLGDYYYDTEVNDFLRQQQTEIDRLTEQRDRLLNQLTESQRELIEWDDSLRISAELLGDSKPTRLPIHKIINMNKALIAEIEAGK